MCGLNHPHSCEACISFWTRQINALTHNATGQARGLTRRFDPFVVCQLLPCPVSTKEIDHGRSIFFDGLLQECRTSCTVTIHVRPV